MTQSEYLEILKEFVSADKPTHFQRLEALHILRQWEEQLYIEEMVFQGTNERLRGVKPYMKPEHYQNLLKAAKQIGHDISEIERNP